MSAHLLGQPGARNSLTDVPGLRVGHHTAIGDGHLTGTTVVLAPDGGMVAGVDTTTFGYVAMFSALILAEACSGATEGSARAPCCAIS